MSFLTDLVDRLPELLETLDGFGGSYLATLGMAAICSYLGLFTVLRRIVFTGVALAQLAAAGVAGAFFVADHPAVPARIANLVAQFGTTLGSLGVTLLGALGLQARPQRHRLSPDALVGLIYTASAAAAILLVWRSSRGLVELRNILAGEVLLTNQLELFFLWIGLILVAALHLSHRRQFLLVSYDPEFTRALGLPERRYQLMFLASLAIAVALSLRAGGLLLVFALLVVPALIGLQLGRRLGESTRLCVASSLAASLIGYLGAIAWNLPVAPTIAATLVVLLIVAGILRRIPLVSDLMRWMLYLLAVASIVVAIIVFPSPDFSFGGDGHGGHAGEGTEEAEGPSPEDRFRTASATLSGFGSPEERVAAITELLALRDGRAVTPLVAALGDDDPNVIASAQSGLRRMAGIFGNKRRIATIADGDDPEFAVHAARALVTVGEKDGVRRLVDALGNNDVPVLLKDVIVTELRGVAGENFGYDVFGEDATNATAVAAWKSWWTKTESRLAWTETDGFKVEAKSGTN